MPLHITVLVALVFGQLGPDYKGVSTYLIHIVDFSDVDTKAYRNQRIF